MISEQTVSHAVEIANGGIEGGWLDQRQQWRTKRVADGHAHDHLGLGGHSLPLQSGESGSENSENGMRVFAYKTESLDAWAKYTVRVDLAVKR